MAIQSSFLSLRYMVSYTPSPTSGSHPHLPVLRRPAHAGHGSLSLQSRSMRTTRPHRLRRLINAIEEEKQETVTASETESSSSNSSVGSGDAKPRSGKGVEIETTEVVASSEIKEAIKEKRRREREGDDLWSGVAEEIREIEWPAFGKVVGTTGVVLGVIAGSSVVLLTVNAVLAELSDRVFAGRGVQDFFS